MPARANLAPRGVTMAPDRTRAAAAVAIRTGPYTPPGAAPLGGGSTRAAGQRRWYNPLAMRRTLLAVCSLMTLVFAAPVVAQDPSDVTARQPGDSVLAPSVEPDNSTKGSGALGWGMFSIGTGSTPYSLPFRLQLQSVDGVTRPGPGPSVVPYLSLGWTKRWDNELADAQQGVADDGTGRLKVGTGVVWRLSPHVNLSGEYRFAYPRTVGLTLRPSPLDRSVGLDVMEFAVGLSIKY